MRLGAGVQLEDHLQLGWVGAGVTSLCCSYGFEPSPESEAKGGWCSAWAVKWGRSRMKLEDGLATETK
jgi:hypothetical protein